MGTRIGQHAGCDIKGSGPPVINDSQGVCSCTEGGKKAQKRGREEDAGRRRACRGDACEEPSRPESKSILLYLNGDADLFESFRIFYFCLRCRLMLEIFFLLRWVIDEDAV